MVYLEKFNDYETIKVKYELITKEVWYNTSSSHFAIPVNTYIVTYILDTQKIIIWPLCVIFEENPAVIFKDYIEG